MAYKLAILLVSLFSQSECWHLFNPCDILFGRTDPSKETFVKMRFSTANLGCRQIHSHEIARLLGGIKGYLYILMHDAIINKPVDEWYSPITDILTTREPESAVLQLYWQYKRTSPWPINKNDVHLAARDMLVILNSITDTFHESKVILIGHGKGALICGVAGRYFHVGNRVLERIIALDPEEIGVNLASRLRISQNDAAWVVVVHTINIYQEKCHNEGHIEFFPNGGEMQPGCGLIDSCDNKRSFQYFLAAVISPDKYVGQECHSYTDYKRHSCVTGHKESLGNLHGTHLGLYFLDIEWLF